MTMTKSGSQVHLVNTTVNVGKYGLHITSQSDSQVHFVNTTVKAENLLVEGGPSISIDKNSQIHCDSGQFASRGGDNGSITVEDSVMTFGFCNSSDRILEGKTAAIVI